MTEGVSLKPDLGPFGVWLSTRSITAELAARIESLGYGAAWIGGSPDAELSWVDPALAGTTSLHLATGIVNIWSAPAAAVAESFHRIESGHPEGFCWASGPATASTPGSTSSRTTRWSPTSTSSTRR
ncbi:hypothetical protein I549_1608 [Mycobacterium avium subsp. avium 2285 (R)]|nr:hypothetical protein I549_1608 [Mycobacterium avium subsp. avium 2285 (R)]